MSQDEHFAVREAFNHAWGLYHEASGVYWNAVKSERAPIDTERLLLAVRTAAAALDTALITLQDYLDGQEPSERHTEDRTRIARIQELLEYELALLPKAEEAS
jgi:hypothetical protein